MKKRRVKAGVKTSFRKPQRELKRRLPENDGASSDFDDSDVNSEDFFHDEIDDFHAGQEKILLGDDKRFKADVSSGEEEVMPITDDEDDLDEAVDEKKEEEDYDYEDDNSVHKSDMESDLEDNIDDDLVNLEAWGKKKSNYLNADFVDKDWGKSYRAEDEEKANDEEMGVSELQLKNLTCDTPGGAFEIGIVKEDLKEAVANEKALGAVKDSNSYSQDGKLKVLKKDSPELFLLADDFKTLMTELIERISPLIKLVKDGRLQGSCAEYIAFKYKFIQQYCVLISSYMMLKSMQIPVKFHPVMKKLTAYKMILNQLEPRDEKMKYEIDIILEKLKNGEGVEFNAESLSEPEEDNAPVDRYAELKLPILKRLIEEQTSKDSSKSKKQKVDSFETETEKEVSSLYMNMRKQQRDAELLPCSDDEEEHQNEEDDYDESMELEDFENDDIAVDEKRTITYQIAKNKGLMPYRKKEYRNPRVRHRMKYRRAKIRRKGQVREPRKEVTRYGGELTGIRTDVARSIKIK